jgi:predicted RecB family nuclease
MSKLIEDHARVLGVRGKTIARLKSINIRTLEDLAEASIDKVRDKLKCTTERAQVLVNKARRMRSGKYHTPQLGYNKSVQVMPSKEER